jgi:hypothetical protein
MIHQSEEYLHKQLTHFYNKLNATATDEKISLVDGSLFITFIKIPQNKVTKILSESALPDSSFIDTDLQELIQAGYINKSNDFEKNHAFVITALGLWSIEVYLNKITTLMLTNYLQDTKFSPGVSERPLKDIEKIILLSMIALRNFSLATSMNLNDKKKSDCWIDIFTKVVKYLKEKRVVEKTDWLPSRAGNEHPINNVMRRANDLPQKSKHIYEMAHGNKYYLGIIGEGDYSKQKLSFLFSIIFRKVESKEDIMNIHSFLCNFAYDEGKNVREDFEYINPDWDSIILDALNEFYYGL